MPAEKLSSELSDKSFFAKALASFESDKQQHAHPKVLMLKLLLANLNGYGRIVIADDMPEVLGAIYTYINNCKNKDNLPEIKTIRIHKNNIDKKTCKK